VSSGKLSLDPSLDEASEITLVDLSPQALHQRLAEGKVYVPSQAQAATTNFLKTEKFNTLREMALRLTTAHVKPEFAFAYAGQGPFRTDEKRERILVAVGITPFSESLIRMTAAGGDAGCFLDCSSC